MEVYPLIETRWFCLGYIVNAVVVGLAIDLERGLVEVHLGFITLLFGDWNQLENT